MDTKPLIDFLDSLATTSQLEESKNAIERKLADILAQFDELKKQNAEQKRLLDGYAKIMENQTVLIAGLNNLVNDKLSCVSEALRNFSDHVDSLTTSSPQQPIITEEHPSPLPPTEEHIDSTDPITPTESNITSESSPSSLTSISSPSIQTSEPTQPTPSTGPITDIVTPDPTPQTLADSIHSEETLADKLSKTVEHTTLASTINSSHIETIQSAITIADRFRFQRELFSGNGALMSSTIADLNSFSTMEQAEAYIKEKFDWDSNNQAVSDFLAIISRKFC
ncbi:MAG: hypothetical protein MJ002_07520 [Paludibacteraceae bacterium]|nr:hypothetical protein [Paludibacteraceae bacterium]